SIGLSVSIVSARKKGSTVLEKTDGINVEQAARLTVGAMLRNQVRVRPNSVALDNGCRRLTFLEFNKRVNQTANLLASQSVGHGDRIALCSENRIEYMELAFACAKLGAILCTLN